MLSTRSARLAATLLLALLMGWGARCYRQRHATPTAGPKRTPSEVLEKSAKNSFPEE